MAGAFCGDSLTHPHRAPRHANADDRAGEWRGNRQQHWWGEPPLPCGGQYHVGHHRVAGTGNAGARTRGNREWLDADSLRRAGRMGVGRISHGELRSLADASIYGHAATNRCDRYGCEHQRWSLALSFRSGHRHGDHHVLGAGCGDTCAWCHREWLGARYLWRHLRLGECRLLAYHFLRRFWMPVVETVIGNVQPLGSSSVDIVIDGGRIVAIGPDVAVGVT